MNHFAFTETPITTSEYLSDKLSAYIQFKREDLFEYAGGGSKARMLQYILRDALDRKATYILTAGGPYSNFSRALALMVGKLGLKMRLVLYDKNKHIGKHSLNKQICDWAGVEYVSCEPNAVAETIEAELDKLRAAGEVPYYIWGGGKSPQGVHAYRACVKAMAGQVTTPPDFIFTAVGTGTTLAGLALGCADVFPNARVVGISVARTKGLVEQVVDNIFAQYDNHVGDKHLCAARNYDIVDDYLLGGYGKYNDAMGSFVNQVIRNEGLILDHIYVGKALYGLFDMVASGQIKKQATIVFMNTGGLFNI